VIKTFEDHEVIHSEMTPEDKEMFTHRRKDDYIPESRTHKNRIIPQSRPERMRRNSQNTVRKQHMPLQSCLSCSRSIQGKTESGMIEGSQ
jgi:hypothetical protein